MYLTSSGGIQPAVTPHESTSAILLWKVKQVDEIEASTNSSSVIVNQIDDGEDELLVHESQIKIVIQNTDDGSDEDEKREFECIIHFIDC